MAKTTITLPDTLLNQAQVLAECLNISCDRLFQMAVEQFIENYQLQFDEASRPALSEPSGMPDQETATRESQTLINQGDVYWLRSDESQSEIRHPHVVIQDNIFNHSRIHTVIVCALTSNLKRATLPGHVLLEVNEANLPRQSVVEISKVSTVDKVQLGDYIGSLSDQRIHQILAGMRFLYSSFFNRS